MTIKMKYVQQFLNALKDNFNYEIEIDTINKILEVPKEKKNGDFSFPCFNLSKFLKKSPVEIASILKDGIKIQGPIEKIEVINGFLNFYILKSSMVRETIEKFSKTKGKLW